MTNYYVFNKEKEQLITAVLAQLPTEEMGFFRFNTHQKDVREMGIPTSNTESKSIRETRPVVVLETNFRPEHEDIRVQALAESEFYSQSYSAVLEYLRTLDNQGNA